MLDIRGVGSGHLKICLCFLHIGEQIQQLDH
jgi:hypothetical protein